LGKPHEEYSRKLEKLRRATGGAPKPAMTTAQQQPVQQQQPSQRSARPTQDRPPREEDSGPGSARSPMAAPRVPTTNNARPAPQRPAQRLNDDDDDFGDVDVGDMLG
jgi:hypothetical protein